MKSAYVGLVLRQVGSHALRRNSQDVIFLQRQLSMLNIYQRGVEGEFSIPSSFPQLADDDDDKSNISVTFVGPWTHRLPAIQVISPSGIKYGSRNDDGNLIAQKWSSRVRFVDPTSKLQVKLGIHE